MIAVFAYDFPHRKTADFLKELAGLGVKDAVVIAAPKQKLPEVDRQSYWKKTLRLAPALEAKVLCENLGFQYVQEAHANVDKIVPLLHAKKCKLGIVAGARILRRQLIEAFPDGIVNFHPGKIPETSGLDAFFYTIQNRADAGVTTHFIDARVDAGDFLAFHPVIYSGADTPESVSEAVYQAQFTALREFWAKYSAGTLTPKKIDRPFKNDPMTSAEKLECLSNFSDWLVERVIRQSTSNLFEACRAGSAAAILSELRRFPENMEKRSPQGWTPLIVALHANQKEAALALLQAGANPNACGMNGTTPLMYAKTPLMGETDPDTTILEALLEHGADIERCDRYGKDIFHYIADEPALLKFFDTQSRGDR